MHAQDKADDLRAGTTRIRFNWVQRAVVSDNGMYNIPYIVTHKRRASDTMIYGYIDPTGLHCILRIENVKSKYIFLSRPYPSTKICYTSWNGLEAWVCGEIGYSSGKGNPAPLASSHTGLEQSQTPIHPSA